MKNFDIEHLERKNIYKVPDHFFESVQYSVLNEIKKSPVKKRSIFSLYWKYVAAACTAIFVGTLAFLEFNNHQDIENSTNVRVIQNRVVDPPATTIRLQNEPKNISKTAQRIITSETGIAENTTMKAVHYLKNAKSKNAIMKVKPLNTEARLEQMIQEIPDAELIDLNHCAAQDIYLDLYY